MQSPYDAGNRGQISADGHSATVSLDIRGDADTATDRIQPVMDAVDAAAAAVLLQAALNAERATGRPPGQLVRAGDGAGA